MTKKPKGKKLPPWMGKAEKKKEPKASNKAAAKGKMPTSWLNKEK